MLEFPQIDPVAMALGPLKIHWYGLCYVVGILLAWHLLNIRSQSRFFDWSREEVSDLVFYATLGVLLGGRIGSVLFYNLSDFLTDPLSIIRIWEGGMSFHGGLLGVILAMYLFCRARGKAFFSATDFIAPVVPIGLGLGRIGNFINGELWGRISDVPWAMVFPRALPEGVARHPSQLYQFLLEGLLLFLILWFYSSKPRPRMRVSGMFLLLYGAFRFIVEFVRQPDLHIGFVAMNWLTMGQLLSLPMIIIGAWFIYHSTKREES